MTALWRGPADRFELARWVDGPHRGFQVFRTVNVGVTVHVRRVARGARSVMDGRPPVDEIWRTFGRWELFHYGVHWRKHVAREIRHCRHLLREARKGNR